MAVILVADDDGHIREVVRFALEKAGHRVIEAADGLAALRAAAEQSIDAVVLDIVMPELDGIEVCRKLRAEAPCRSSSCPAATTSSTACSGSSSAPTTTSPSPSARASWRRA
jgi:CheY-like chemotaxis protein